MRHTVPAHTLRLTRQVDSLPEMLYNVYNVPPSTKGTATEALSSIASLPGTRTCAHTSLFSAETCMNWTRSSGILLHPTSLPGRFGVGDLGQAAYRWIGFLAASHQALKTYANAAASRLPAAWPPSPPWPSSPCKTCWAWAARRA
jgi:hypothetical protein